MTIELTFLTTSSDSWHAEIGILKAESALGLSRDWTSISVDAITERLNESNAEDLFKNHNIIIDGTDNIPTRYLLMNCRIGIPWVYGWYIDSKDKYLCSITKEVRY